MYFRNYLCKTWSHGRDIIDSCIAFFSKSLTLPTSQNNISVRAEWLCQSGRAPSEPPETPQWRITPCPASIPRIALHIALLLLVHSLFLLYRFPILNERSGVVANCDHTSEWDYWVRTCIGIGMGWMTLPKSRLAFRLLACKIHFFRY
jgi:hypothetical protein